VIPSIRNIGFTAATALMLAVFVGLLVADDVQRAERLERLAPAEFADTGDVQVPSASALRSVWVSQTVPEVIVLGKEATATFVYRNIGSMPWVRGTAAEARLGIVGDDRRFFDLGLGRNWPAPDRVAVQTERVVRAGELATFTFGLRGNVTGRHHIRVRPVVDGVTWMDDDGAYLDVVVSASGA
jgi:hypothetical protein